MLRKKFVIRRVVTFLILALLWAGCEGELLGFTVSDESDPIYDAGGIFDDGSSSDDIDTQMNQNDDNSDSKTDDDNPVCPDTSADCDSEGPPEDPKADGGEDETDSDGISTETDLDNSSNDCVCELHDVDCEIGEGLRARYYENEHRRKMVIERIEGPISFSWGNQSPVAGIPADDFRVKWTGRIRSPYTNRARFLVRYSNSNEGVRLRIDQKRIIDVWKPLKHKGEIVLASDFISLKKGKYYHIQLEYYDKKGTASIELLWQFKNRPRSIVPATCLYPGRSHRFSTYETYEAVNEDLGCTAVALSKDGKRSLTSKIVRLLLPLSFR